MKRLNGSMSGSAGQMTIEMILLMTLFLGLSVMVSNYIREERVLASMIQGPWVYVQGMIENGVWMPPAQGKANHPNDIKRHGTVEGDPAK